MRRSLFLLISLVLIGCSANTITGTPTSPPPSALPPSSLTPAVETPTPPKPAVTHIVETPTSFPSITLFVTEAPTDETQTPAQVSATPTKLSCNSIPISDAPPATELLGVWRVRHDVERKDLDCKSRLWVKNWNKNRGLPETVRINGGRGTVELSPAWVKFLDKINTPDAQRYLRKLQSGWLNSGPFPKMEQLTFGGNFVYVTRIKGNKAYIKTYNNADAPPEAGPDTLIQTFSVVYTDGSWEMFTPVGVAYTFIIANPKDGPLWIDIKYLIR